MFVPLWLLALAGVAFVLLAWLAFRPRGGGGEMIQGQQRDARHLASHAPHHRAALHRDQAAILAAPEIRAALARGQKLEAIRLVRERSGLGLKEAKELVERHRA
jgi:hypothetical protein